MPMADAIQKAGNAKGTNFADAPAEMEINRPMDATNNPYRQADSTSVAERRRSAKRNFNLFLCIGQLLAAKSDVKVPSPAVGEGAEAGHPVKALFDDLAVHHFLVVPTFHKLGFLQAGHELVKGRASFEHPALLQPLA